MDLGARLGVNFLLRLGWHEESDRDHIFWFVVVWCGKYFVGNYKYNKISKYYPLGKFVFGGYGIQQACDDWTELNKLSYLYNFV